MFKLRTLRLVGIRVATYMVYSQQRNYMYSIDYTTVKYTVQVYVVSIRVNTIHTTYTLTYKQTSHAQICEQQTHSSVCYMYRSKIMIQSTTVRY